ncbi:hypothetical protein [Mucilaginibacter sp. KACC 22063]|uniref:hypothetical protein n=1 Tax=Mucilaginibacter sp. KACC 22063 TaxID=3025666 RepID=UPI002365D930|nr:hypothetical protein [Mucilaginibacter sp. KACC 22063]WDF56164.1 hypothetical protein PQ461_03700 [Mucilaginibacter sp. KACC 22063]
MKTTKEFNLIHGDFKPADAESLIKTFYNEKIRHHNCQLLHMMESDKGDQHPVLSKIAELECTSRQIREFLQHSSSNGNTVHVTGNILITVND